MLDLAVRRCAARAARHFGSHYLEILRDWLAHRPYAHRLRDIRDEFRCLAADTTADAGTAAPEIPLLDKLCGPHGRFMPGESDEPYHGPFSPHWRSAIRPSEIAGVVCDWSDGLCRRNRCIAANSCRGVHIA